MSMANSVRCRARYGNMLPPAAAIARAPSPQPSSTAAVIENSGSTNTAAFSVTVRADGGIVVTQPGETRASRVPKVLAERLYDDLARVGALDALPSGVCMKSMSFGTRLTVAYHGRRTPDLSCAQNDAERTLNADANAILNAAHIVTHSQYHRPQPIAAPEPSTTP